MTRRLKFQWGLSFFRRCHARPSLQCFYADWPHRQFGLIFVSCTIFFHAWASRLTGLVSSISFIFIFFIFFSFLFFNHFSNRPTTFVSFRYFYSSNFFSSSSFHIFFFSIHCDYAGKLKFILAWLVCAFIMSHQPFANTHFRFSSTIQTTSLHVSPSPLNSPVSNAVDTVLSENNPCASDGDAFQIIILVCFPCWHFFMCLFSAFVLTETASIKQLSLSPTWVETRLNLFTNLL